MMGRITPHLVYQRWLEFDLPEGIEEGCIPQWVWPVVLSDGSAVVTLLYRPLASPEVVRRGPRCVILQVSPEGQAQVWRPGEGYPSPVIFYVNALDELFGMDLSKPGSVYGCKVDGTHLYTLELSLRMANLIAPAGFYQQGEVLHWMAGDGQRWAGRLTAGGLEGVAKDTTPLPDAAEVRFPHTHLCADGSLFVFDFDPMARVSRYRLGEEKKAT